MVNQVINIDREILGGTPVFFATQLPLNMVRLFQAP